MVGGPAVVPATLPVRARPPDTFNWLCGRPPSRDGPEPVHGRLPVRAPALGQGWAYDRERAYVLVRVPDGAARRWSGPPPPAGPAVVRARAATAARAPSRSLRWPAGYGGSLLPGSGTSDR